MSLHIDNITVNTTRPRELAEWWVNALSGTILSDHGDFVFTKVGELGLAFQRVEEARAAGNTVHFDLDTDDRAAQVERLIGLGATVEEEHRGTTAQWTVLSDPDGNLFCVTQVG